MLSSCHSDPLASDCLVYVLQGQTKFFVFQYISLHSQRPLLCKLALAICNFSLSQLITLLQNGYLSGIISYNMNDVLNKHRDQPSKPITTVPKKDIIIVLPYLGFQSKAITHGLKSCISNFYGFLNLRLIFHNTCCIVFFSL